MKAAVATTAVLVVILAACYKVYLEPLYNEFVESDYHNRFFEGRVEYTIQKCTIVRIDH